MTDRVAARVAWGLFGFAALIFLGGLWFFVLNRSTHYEGVASSDSFATGIFIAFAAVGAPVSAKQPRNPIGWILLAIGLGWSVYAVLIGYSLYGVVTSPGSVPRPDLALAVINVGWLPGIGLMGTFLLLLFPTGRPPSPRWRPLAWCSMFVVVVGPVLGLFVPGTFANIGFPDIVNPLGIEPLRPVAEPLAAIVVLLLVVCIVGSVASLIGRFRRSFGRDRLQMKWLAAGGSGVAVCYVGSALLHFVEGSDDASWLAVVDQVAVLSFLLIPIAIGIAILRYRLFDIDRIINRTLVYGALTATLGIAYVSVVTVLQRLSAPLTHDNTQAVAGSTLAVAALIRPARRRIQRFIDRRFYRAKFNAQRAIDDFSAQLREEVDLQALARDLLGVVDEALKPAHSSLWLLGGNEAWEHDQ